MNTNKISMLIVFTGALAITNSCSADNGRSPQTLLVGSTPSNQYIKSVLRIDSPTSIDFIKWLLTLDNEINGAGTFSLSLNFGASQPNTTGFIGGGEKRRITGNYIKTRRTIGQMSTSITHLVSSQLSDTLSLMQIDENMFHLLSESHQLMVGGGDYSFTLNRNNLIKSSGRIQSFVKQAFPAGDTATTIILDARTPCVEIARDNHLQVQPGCFKLKWKITLHRDPLTLQPATYTIRRVDERPSSMEGKWTIVQNQVSNPSAIVYRLDPVTQDSALFLLVGDHNVLFLLNHEQQLYYGNELHSYTFNRRGK
jgi:hypothetical protein